MAAPRRSESLDLKVERIVDPDVYELTRRLRSERAPKKYGGLGASPEHVLSGLLRCGKCGASYQTETSGKCIDDGVYRYCYYNCRTACRVGKEQCSGFPCCLEFHRYGFRGRRGDRS